MNMHCIFLCIGQFEDVDHKFELYKNSVDKFALDSNDATV